MDITSFDGKYDFLSNFYEVAVRYGYDYGSAEAAYQAQKATDSDDKSKFTEYTPAQAKRMGRKVDMRSDWEEVKVAYMRDILFAKFVQNPELAKRLLATSDSTLIEGNDWHDTFWGVDSKTGEGQNILGKLLMELREELKNPAIQLLNKNIATLTRFSAPELVIFDWYPPKTVFRWTQPNNKELLLPFEMFYEIEPADVESLVGIEDCVWHFHGRLFADLDFLLGETLEVLNDDYNNVQKIKQYDDDKKFFYQADKIPTFDDGDTEWDSVNEFVIFRDEGGVHLIRSQHGWKIPNILIYTGLKNSVPALDEILARLES